MANNQYRCIAPFVNIRSQPHIDPQNKTGQLKFNEMLTVNIQTRTDAEGYTWLQHSRGWSVERSLDGKIIYLSDALRPKDRLWGINIDPRNPSARAPADKLLGTGWVRFVFHAFSHNETLEQAFAFYDPLITAYHQAGTRVLLILIQDTFGGNAPWLNNGDWNAYARDFAVAAGTIARHYRGQVAAYEIWNEMDVPTGPGTSSIYIAESNYAKLLLTTSQAIAQADPSAQVITGGLAGPEAPWDYIKKVQAALNGAFPANGIALHPYLQIPPDLTAEPFPNWAQGHLLDTLWQIAENLPGIPVWITEIGVPDVPDVNNTAYWSQIANYMDKTMAFIRSSFPQQIAAVMWFAWSDAQRNAGITNPAQQPKGMLYNTFFKNVHVDYPATRCASPTPFDGKLLLAHVSADGETGPSISQAVSTLHTGAPNVAGLIVRANLTNLAQWSAALAHNRLDLHAWYQIKGQDTAAEVALIQQSARAPGVLSLILDLDPAVLVIKSSAAIRNFMIAVRRVLPPPFPIGLSFDGRPENYAAVSLPDWYPFITSWHPKIFHWQFSNATQAPDTYLAAAFNGLSQYPKPVIPMLQAEPTAGKPVSPNHIRQAARLSMETYNAPSVSFWRLEVLGQPEFDTIRGLYVPWLAGTTVIPMLGMLATQTSTPLNVRAVPSPDGAVLDQLQHGQQIIALERLTVGTLDWVRHSLGWSLVHNPTTGETYLA